MEGVKNAWKDKRVSAFIRVLRVDTDYWEFRIWTAVFKHNIYFCSREEEHVLENCQ